MAIEDRAAALAPVFRAAAAEYGLPAELLMGIAEVESGFVANAVNPSSGAAGVMQVMPLHFAALGWELPEHIDAPALRGYGGSGWNIPDRNIRAGASILADQLRWRGSIDEALAGYGGHVTTDPAPYVRKVKGAAARWAHLVAPAAAGAGVVVLVAALAWAWTRKAER